MGKKLEGGLGKEGTNVVEGGHSDVVEVAEEGEEALAQLVVPQLPRNCGIIVLIV